MLSLNGFAVKVATGCDSGGRCDWMQPDRLYSALFFFFFLLFCESQASGGNKNGSFLLLLSSQ